MRSKFQSSLAIVALTAVFVASCAKKQVKPEDTTAAATGTEATATPPSDTIDSKPIGLDPKGSDGGSIPGLSTVFFEYDQARLTADARKKLAENADWIKNNSNLTIQIEGHTDERGSVEYNLSLGERRAKSVKAYLESLGIDSKRMNIISYGEEKPLAPGDSESAWSKNRRANFVPLQ